MDKRIKYLTLLFLVISVLGCGNIPVLKSKELSDLKNFNINDEFDNNKYKWEEVKNKEVEIKVANGYYNIEHKLKKYAWRVFHTFKFRKDKIYFGETSIRYEKGNNDDGFGIYFGLSDKTYIFFEIDNLGELGIFEDKGAITTNALDWIKTKAVNISDWNIFEFVLGNGILKVYLNNYNIGSMNLNKLKLQEVGYEVNGKLKVNIDYMKGKSINN